MKICQNCSAENGDTALFCKECGMALLKSIQDTYEAPSNDSIVDITEEADALSSQNEEKICPLCGNMCKSHIHFCAQCGYSFDEKTAAQDKLCPNCNNKCKINASFCDACGRSFNNSNNEETTHNDSKFNTVKIRINSFCGDLVLADNIIQVYLFGSIFAPKRKLNHTYKCSDIVSTRIKYERNGPFYCIALRNGLLYEYNFNKSDEPVIKEIDRVIQSQIEH